jgi:hypothetical protein
MERCTPDIAVAMVCTCRDVRLHARDTARSPEASAVMDVAFGATVNDADTPAEYLWIFFGGI